MLGSALLAWSHKQGLFRAIWFCAKASLNDSLLGYLENPFSIRLLCSFQKYHSALWLLFWDWVCHEHSFSCSPCGATYTSSLTSQLSQGPLSQTARKARSWQRRERKCFPSHLSTPTLLTSDLCPMVDSLVHLNWFQASASCFSDQSAQISAQLSVSLTAKH